MALGLATGKTRAGKTKYQVAPEPEHVDEETQSRLTIEARERFNATRPEELLDNQAMVIATKIAKVQRQAAKHGIDLGPAFQRFIREQQQEIVKAKREAA